VAVNYTRAIRVAVGEKITSTQLARLCDAINDRFRYGLADCPWRLRYYWLSLFRQVRNPDASYNLWPPLAEFFERLQMLKPVKGEWPVTGPGDPEGANLASQMIAFVHGNPWTYSEDLRLGDESYGGIPIALGVLPAANDGEAWELAKRQRGSYDPDSGNISASAITAAKSYGAIFYSPYSPHGNSYGDWVASPQLTGTPCEDPDTGDDSGPPPNYDIFFTKLDGTIACPADTSAVGDTCHYAGTCLIGPSTTEDYSKHLAGIAETPFSYFVFLNDGTIQELSKSKWILGPFTGEAVLRKQANNGIARMVNAFASEFRGTDTQRAENAWNSKAFSFEKFLKSQYLLAPNIGKQAGDFITALYPTDTFDSNPTLNHTTGAAHEYRAGFVCTGAVAIATKLDNACAVEVLNGTTVIGTLNLVPDGDGNASQSVTFAAPLTPNPLRFRMKGAANFNTGGSIRCEATELLEYKPQLPDLYAVLRLGGVSFGALVDGSGTDEESARTIGDNYFRYGAIINVHGEPAMPGSLDQVNLNAVFDAARRFSQMVRIMNREMLIGYEVVDGKSILYFKRLGWDDVDMFEGIAPPRDPVPTGSIEEGEVYEVRDATVHYELVPYEPGETFTGVAGKKDFTGTGLVYVHEGIRSVALKNGFTSEWLLGFEFKSYHLSESSTWKPAAYGDYFPLVNRCLFFSPEIANDQTLLWHTAFGQAVYGPDGNLIAEAPSGYNYATLPEGAYAGGLNVNTVGCGGDPACEEYRLNFYKSCRIYEREPEAESCTILIEGGAEVVKMVFKTRFHHAPSAPATIARDFSTWDNDVITAEEFRSTENAIRQYIMNAYWGGNCAPGGVTPIGGAPTGQPGNAAMRSQVQILGDNPNGSCYPHFGFTKLLPKPYEDDNDDQDEHDTPFMHDTLRHAETMLRAMCEGYIDGETTTKNLCDYSTVNLFAYQFENLMFQASGGRMTWIPTLGSLATTKTKVENTRPDAPEGFGPLPNTRAMAETFNLFVDAVNLLTDVRVMLPFVFECKDSVGNVSQLIGGALNAEREGVPSATDSYSGASDFAVWTSNPAPAPSSFVDGTWGPCSGIVPVSEMLPSWDEGAQAMTLNSQVIKVHWRYTVVDPDAINAIPEEWRDMLETDAVMLATREDITRRLKVRQGLSEEGPNCSLFSSSIVWDNSTGALVFDEIADGVDDVRCLFLPSSGGLAPPAFPGSDAYVADQLGLPGTCSLGPRTQSIVIPKNVNDAMIRVPLIG
jgi:hypothetical protein